MPSRLPPGQYLTQDFPVLSLGPTPKIDVSTWQLTISGQVDLPLTYSWDQLSRLAKTEIIADIHCVTKWSKYDTAWTGIDLLSLISHSRPQHATHLVAHSADGYTTNIPFNEIVGQVAIVATEFSHQPIPAIHGGPVRLVIPHLYFWKSAKWLTGLELLTHDQPGFWEVRGYHNHGDPWQEERYSP
jgi:DMSO/TMAO reductase YedYZ molybdopterin-dependent catalytic subunit